MRLREKFLKNTNIKDVDNFDSLVSLLGDLYKLDDDVLSEDIDILSKYIVTRFFKMSPHFNSLSSKEQIIEHLNAFVKDIYPFIITFVHVVNMQPVSSVNAIES